MSSLTKWESPCGRVVLYCNDCLEVLPTIGNVDAVVTDPPYGVEFKGSATKHSHRDGVGYASFDDTPENVESQIVPRVVSAIRIAERAAITPGLRCQWMYPKPDAVGVIWYPSGGNVGPWGFVTHQPIYYYGKCVYLAHGMGSRPTGFSTTEASDKTINHPCPKPIGQMRWLVERVSLDGETIVDPFMGSGTTGVAAVQLGRKFIGIEKEPAYFEIAKRRIMDALGMEVSVNGVKQRRMFTEPTT